MHFFLNGSNADYEQLCQKAQGHRIVYRDQEMPPDSTPPQAHIGFQVMPQDGRAILYVENCVLYRGNSQAVKEWLMTGQKRFGNFASLQHWIQHELAEVYAGSRAPERVNPHDLTNIRAVHQGIQRPKPAFVDEGDLFQRLALRVRGQDGALRSLAGQFCRHMAKSNPCRPAVFFAVGPTGVGKTLTAESLPQVLKEVGHADANYGYVRLDMSEYQESYRVSQLTGSPPGYVGYNEGSHLVDAILANPKTICLFDEIEKAHPAIFRTLMNVMDAGRLSTPAKTNGSREIDCCQTVLIFTSNLDADGILNELTQRNALGQMVTEDDVCRRRLRAAGLGPEIVGRIGRFLVFQPLTIEARAEVVTQVVVDVASEYRVAVARVAPEVIVHILLTARQQGFGVRPERYLIDELLGTSFANAAESRLQGPWEVKVKEPCDSNGQAQFECVPLIA
jgi:ATP-dependent Clp protease ATP-binding subunit ClpA